MRNLFKLRRQEQGLTLIEMLIVVAILGVTAGVLTPNVTGMLDRGGSKTYDADKRTIEAAVYSFWADVHEGPYNDGGTWLWGADDALLPGHYFPTEQGKASDIESSQIQLYGNSTRHILYIDDITTNKAYDTGEEATDKEIASAAIWMGLLVNPSKVSTGAGDSDRSAAAPKQGESDLYLTDFPKSCSSINGGNNNHDDDDGLYIWIVGKGGRVYGAYNDGLYWYTGYTNHK